MGKDELQTERLILRPWRDSDAESLFRYARDPGVGPACGWRPHTSVMDSAQVIKEVLSVPESYAITLKEAFADAAAGEAVGSIGILLGSKGGHGPKEAEIGYWIGVPFWGKGYVPEAVNEIMRHCFEDLSMETLWCGYYDGNEKSKRVQEKCGFAYHDTVKDKQVPLLNEVRTEHYTSISRMIWEWGRKSR